MIKSVCMYPLGEPTRLLDDDNMVREARMQNRRQHVKRYSIIVIIGMNRKLIKWILCHLQADVDKVMSEIPKINAQLNQIRSV